MLFSNFARSKCQKICEQLDSRNGIETPEHEWFWPSKAEVRTDSSDEEDCEPEEEYDSDSEKSKTENSDSDTADGADDDDGRPKKRTKRKQQPLKRPEEAEPNAEFNVNTSFSCGISNLKNDFFHLQLEEQVDTLLAHLRSKYFYCLWCGVQYGDAADIEASCPDPSKDAH